MDRRRFLALGTAAALAGCTGDGAGSDGGRTTTGGTPTDGDGPTLETPGCPVDPGG